MSRKDLGEAGEFEGAEEDVGEHRTVEAAGVGVAKGGVVAAEEGEAVGEEVLGTVGEGEGGTAFDDSLAEEMGEEAVPGDLAEADDDADFGEGGDLSGEVGGAVADLLRGGLVAGRGAADDGADPELAELEAVVAADGHGFGGEAEDEDAGVGVAEAGDGLGPVLLVAVGFAAVLANATAVVAEPGAAGAGDDGALELVENC